MDISCMISSTSSSAFSTSITLIATAWPVRFSTLEEDGQWSGPCMRGCDCDSPLVHLSEAASSYYLVSVWALISLPNGLVLTNTSLLGIKRLGIYCPSTKRARHVEAVVLVAAAGCSCSGVL